jgi:DNA-binding SARP family transcriptional activator
MLNVTLLGGTSFSLDDTVIKSDLGPSGRLLACYLFEFMGRVHRRERLADLFWSELEPEKGRSALNTALWRIRKMLGAAVEGGSDRLVTIGDDVLLEPASFIRVDTHGLQSACRLTVDRKGRSELTEADEEVVGAAVVNYGGPFLDGDDGDWILQERERLHCLFVTSTLELMRLAARRGRFERALDYGRLVLSADPLRESVQRDLMLLLVLNGQRANAIHTYRRLKAILKSDLCIEPMPDTKRLYQDIISGEIFEHLEQLTSMYFAPHSHGSR